MTWPATGALICMRPSSEPMATSRSWLVCTSPRTSDSWVETSFRYSCSRCAILSFSSAIELCERWMLVCRSAIAVRSSACACSSCKAWLRGA
jgi:hypothetical protein